jgi:hypothetical protein
MPQAHGTVLTLTEAGTAAVVGGAWTFDRTAGVIGVAAGAGGNCVGGGFGGGVVTVAQSICPGCTCDAFARMIIGKGDKWPAKMT